MLEDDVVTGPEGRAEPGRSCWSFGGARRWRGSVNAAQAVPLVALLSRRGDAGTSYGSETPLRSLPAPSGPICTPSSWAARLLEELGEEGQRLEVALDEYRAVITLSGKPGQPLTPAFLRDPSRRPVTGRTYLVELQAVRSTRHRTKPAGVGTSIGWPGSGAPDPGSASSAAPSQEAPMGFDAATCGALDAWRLPLLPGTCGIQ